MTVQTAPCDWPISYAECVGSSPASGLPEAYDGLSAEAVAIYESLATEYLWRWTGRAFGICTMEVRPCREDCSDGRSTFFGSGPIPGGGGLWRPVIIDGLWYNISCGRCTDECSCTSVERLTLAGPVNSIVSVEIDGETLPSTAYRVDNGRYLVRTDGGVWPTCNDLSLPLGEPGTWAVTYERGVPVPVGGQVAAGVLAVEFAKAACGADDCALPKRVQSITRQGVTIAMLDSFDDVDKGHTGIWIIDAWLASIMQVPQRARVLSPDLRKAPVTRRL